MARVEGRCPQCARTVGLRQAGRGGRLLVLARHKAAVFDTKHDPFCPGSGTEPDGDSAQAPSG